MRQYKQGESTTMKAPDRKPASPTDANLRPSATGSTTKQPQCVKLGQFLIVKSANTCGASTPKPTPPRNGGDLTNFLRSRSKRATKQAGSYEPLWMKVAKDLATAVIKQRKRKRHDPALVSRLQQLMGQDNPSLLREAQMDEIVAPG